MKRITFVFALLLLCVPQFALAQTIRVTGTVRAASDDYPLEGVSVQVKGSKVGVATDLNGNYVVNAARDAVLIFSSISYKTVEIPVNGRSVINVDLEEDQETLEATIVVGYGTARKISNVVGSAQAVKAKALQDKPVINAADALQGQVAGLQIFSSSGDPSATVSMRLRGISSINASNAPLFVLDGVPVLSDIFSTINANDIESVTVLKDASSTAIYGARAANGVVYITTKRGMGEKPTVKVSGHYGISNIARNPVRKMNSAEWYAFQEISDPSLLNDAGYLADKEFRLKNNIGTNWKRWILNQNAPTVGGDMSVSGRTKTTDYYVSLSVNRQTGIEQNTGMTRYAVRTNLNTRANDWFKFGINLGLAYQASRITNYNTTGNSWYNPLNIAAWSLPWASVRDILTDDNGNFLGYGVELAYIPDLGMFNNKYLNKYRPNKDNTVRINGNTYEEFTPLKGLTIRFGQGLEGYDYRYTTKLLLDPGDPITGQRAFTSMRHGEEFSRYYRISTTNTVEYKFTLGEKHNFILLGGQEAIINRSNGFYIYMEGMEDNRLWALNRGTDIYTQSGTRYLSYSLSQYKYNSIFSRLSYDYDGKYFLDASIRRDGSSLFGENNRYANFWSVGAMWNIKKENFLKDSEWLDKLQLSASYGTVGNSGISNYLSIPTVGESATLYDGSKAWYLSLPGNPDLTWETIETANIGVDTRLFNFVDAKVEVYHKKTKDMLLSIPYSYATGFASGYGNVGNMVNKGIEATFTFDVLRKENTQLTLTLNASYNKNKLTKFLDTRDYFEVANTGLRYQIGHDIGELYYAKYAGVDPATGRDLWYDLDGNPTPDYSDDLKQYTGKSRYAPWAGGLQIDFAYKNFSVQAQFTGFFKKYMVNNDAYFYTHAAFASESNLAAEVLYKTWTTPGQKAKYPSPEYDQTSIFDTRYIENASFVRLKGLTLSYSLGKAALNALGNTFTGARVFVTGRNLWTLTKYKGWDPETDTNVSSGRYPNSQEVSVGVEITF